MPQNAPLSSMSRSHGDSSIMAKRTDPKTAGKIIKEGGLVAFPTETVYGLGANALNEAAVRKIFEAKGRPSSNPIICHLASVEDVFRFGESSELARKLSEFWPGPLTLLLPHHGKIPTIVTAGSPLAGFRIPDHPLTLNFLKEAGVPVAAPSANLSNTRSPTSADMVDRQLGDRIDAIIDGGVCRVGVESTVVRLEGDGIRILREGGITREQFENAGISVLNEGDENKEGPPTITTIKSDQKKENTHASSDLLESPGRLPIHYAPEIPMALLEFTGDIKEGDNWPGLPVEDPVVVIDSSTCKIRKGHFGDKKEGDTIVPSILCMIPPLPQLRCAPPPPVNLLSPEGDLKKAAHDLFRALDAYRGKKFDIIFTVLPPRKGLGRAIGDRLRRASTYLAFVQYDKILLYRKLK